MPREALDVVRARRYAGGVDGNRSLERGIEILRAFRPGVDTLGNGEIEPDCRDRRSAG
jgi:hypothetical protein